MQKALVGPFVASADEPVVEKVEYKSKYEMLDKIEELERELALLKVENRCVKSSIANMEEVDGAKMNELFSSDTSSSVTVNDKDYDKMEEDEDSDDNMVIAKLKGQKGKPYFIDSFSISFSC